MQVRDFDFAGQLIMSSGHAASAEVKDILLACLPGATNVTKASNHNDRMGVDWWVEMPGRHIAVDAKVRESDWAASHPDQDDLALETWSVVERGKIGWTRDASKRCDFVLWLWQDTGRHCLVSFPMLCRVFCDNWEQWKSLYKKNVQRTVGGGMDYHSECIFVPRKVLWREMYLCYGGNPTIKEVVF